MDGEDTHECFHCGEEFSSTIDFNIHLETHSKNGTSSKGKVDLTDKGGKPHECFHCGEGFYTTSDLDKHMKIHDTAKNQTVIKKSSIDTGGVVDLTDPAEDQHECFHCGEEFAREDDLNSHLVEQHQVKPHKCDQCREVFMHQYQLEAHKLLHKDVSARVMSDVEMMYRSYNNTRVSTSSYKDEVGEAGSTSQSEYECTYCGQFFKNQGALSTHKLTHTAKQCHKCTYCSKTFLRPSDLKRHLVMHTGEKTNACHLCPKKFSQASALYHHMRNCHRTQPHICDHCGEGFYKIADLRAHKRSHLEDDSYEVPQKKPYLSQLTEDGNLYKCAQCGDSFTEKYALDVHSQIHMSNTIEIIPETDNENCTAGLPQLSRDVGTFNCPKCTKIFAEEAELNRHKVMCIPSSMDLSIHVKKEENSERINNITDLGVVDLTLDDDDDDDVDGADQHFCTHCGKSFHLEVELNAHLIMFHSTPDSHECFHCGEEFDTEDELKLHVLTTHDGKGLKHHECQDCDQTFLLLSDFEDHKKQKHPVCKVCGKNFTRKSLLERHMRDNHDRGCFTCNYCQKSCSTKAELDTHKNTQHKKPSQSQNEASTSSQENVYKSYSSVEFSDADISKKQEGTFSDVVDLTIDDDEIYKCSICNDVYSREEELIVHMMTHPKQEPFECPECGKRFVFEKDYRFHLRTHVKAENIKKRPSSTNTGEKPHECPVCQKRFASKDVLNRHKATHGAEPHKCPHCGAGFWQNYYLQRHLQRDCKRLQKGTMQNGNISGTSTFDIPNMTLPKITSVQTIVEKAQHKNDGINSGPLPMNKPQVIVPQPPITMPIKQETYTCCGWSFMSEADMKLHELSHKVTVYKCVQCKQVFRSPAELDTHVKTHRQTSSPRKVPHHDESSNSSTLTASSTGYVEDLPTSFSPKKEKHECHQCGKFFKTEGYLNRHMRLHKSQVLRTEKSYRCTECGQRFLSEAGLTKHAATHADNKPNQCPICNENFENSAKLFEHMATHESGKAHTCPQCGKTFKRSASLKSHIRMHAQEFGDTHGEQGDFNENDDMPNSSVPDIPRPDIPRQNIPAPFIPTPSIYAAKASKPNGANLIPSQMQLPHVRQEGEADTGHMCTYCGKKFIKESLLKRHFRKHMRILSSTYCETKVKFDATGKELRTVTRIRKKRFKCYICYKMFRTPSDLVRHMMIHTGERPCKCSWCPQGFILLHSLKRHTLKYHRDIPPRDGDLGEKEKEDASDATSEADKGKKGKHLKYVRPAGYLCCGIRFPTFLDIQHHWLVHKEEEAYACPHCELRFTKGYTRTKHIMKVHSATKRNCLDCGKEFTHFDKLIEHMKVHEAQLVGKVPESSAAPASTNRVEVYTDVADSEPTSSNRVEVYTDVADVDSVLVKTEVIPDEEDEDPHEAPVLPRLDNILHTAPDPLLLKQESGLNSDQEIECTDPDVSPTDPKLHPIALKKEASVDTIGDPSSPVDDAVLDSEPEEGPLVPKKETILDTATAVAPTPNENSGHDTEINVST